MNRIGERIKKKRELMNMQLNVLADKVDITPSALSQIEKSKSFPSILTLKAIAEALHTTIGDLVGENESLTNNPVVLKEDIRFIERTDAGASLYLLSNHDANKQMDTCLLRLEVGSNAEDLIKPKHGQVFCHILSGEIQVVMNEKQYNLHPGDNLYFNVKGGFSVVNKGDCMSEVLWIQSPPNY